MLEMVQNLFLPDPEALGNFPQIHGVMLQGLGDFLAKRLGFFPRRIIGIHKPSYR